MTPDNCYKPSRLSWCDSTLCLVVRFSLPSPHQIRDRLIWGRFNAARNRDTYCVLCCCILCTFSWDRLCFVYYEEMVDACKPLVFSALVCSMVRQCRRVCCHRVLPTWSNNPEHVCPCESHRFLGSPCLIRFFRQLFTGWFSLETRYVTEI